MIFYLSCLLLFFTTPIFSYQLLSDVMNYPGGSYEIENYAQDPTLREYKYYISSVFYSPTLKNTSQIAEDRYVIPTPIVVIDLTKKAFEILERTSEIDGLTFTYGGTFDRVSFPSNETIFRSLIDSRFNGAIYIDYSGNIGDESQFAAMATPKRADSNDSYAKGGYISVNTRQSDYSHPQNTKTVNLILHETLHTLGLGHSTSRGSLLSYNDIAYWGLSNDDKIALKQIYPSADSVNSVSVSTRLDGGIAKGVEVVYINIVSGKSYMVMTDPQGQATTKNLPNGSYWVVGRQFSKAASGPCFDSPTIGFLSSFYQNDSNSTNDPTLAGAITLSGVTELSLTLNLIAGKRHFECFQGANGRASVTGLTYPINANMDIDLVSEFARPGHVVMSDLPTDLSLYTLGWPIGIIGDTDIDSGYHETITLSLLGSHPVMNIKEMRLGTSGGMGVLAAIEVAPDAPHGAYAALCESRGEYTVNPAIVEVNEIGPYSYPVMYIPERENDFNYSYSNYIFNNLYETDIKNFKKLKYLINFPFLLFGFYLFRSRKKKKGVLTLTLILGLTLGASLSLSSCAPGDSIKDSEIKNSVSNLGKPVNMFFNAFRSDSWSEGNWTSLTKNGEPTARDFHTAVWTGTEMIIWGGNINLGGYASDGASYNPETDLWTDLPVSPLSARAGHTTIWTGTEMIIWGGRDDTGALGDGASYNPTTQTWTMLSLTGAPSARVGHAVAWTGSKMLIWGGRGSSVNYNNGFSYDPTLSTWSSIASTNAPTARFSPGYAWTGSALVIWGGNNLSTRFNDGAIYNPTLDSWMTMNSENAPEARTKMGFGYFNGKIFLFGGEGNSQFYASAFTYDLTENSWEQISTLGDDYTELGYSFLVTTPLTDRVLFTGGLVYFDPMQYVAPNWTTKTSDDINLITDLTIARSFQADPINPRKGHTAIWTGEKLIIWGGAGNSYLIDVDDRLGRGAIYTP